jgi:hypothetical protein
MTGLSALWLPALLSAVLVFIASSIIHMASPWHKSDYPKVPGEDRVMDAMRPLAIPPGDYMMPRPASREDMRSPEFLDKMKKGPVMMITVFPQGEMSMGRNLGMWFVYCAVVSVLAGYIAERAVGPHAAFRPVFKFTGAIAFIGYVLALWQMSIWYRRAWSTTIKATIDGAIYATLTAAAFGWLWPR